MRVLVTGSRDWDRQDVVDGVLDIIAENAAAIGDEVVVIVHGACFPKPDENGVTPRISADSSGTTGCMRLAEEAEIHVQPLIYEELPPPADSLPERAS